MSDFIYLASQSPRRRQLLEQIGVPHRLLLAEAHEDAESLETRSGRESARTYVERVTALKLDAAMRRLAERHALSAPEWPLAAILCADTTVALGRDILGKPTDAAEAREMLSRLSGRTHRVLTALALQWGRRRWQAVSESMVSFAPMSRAQIHSYVASGEPMGKAGAYGIQGLAAQHVSRIQGSYSGIMGLPLHETAQLLRHVRLG